MMELIHATLHLYREALKATVRSFVRSWIIAVAVVVFAAVMMVAGGILGRLGMLGGLLLGALNALLVGATLILIEEAVKSSRPLTFHDIRGSFGHYFWDVIGVLFVLWIPIMALEMAAAGIPNGPLLSSGVFLLLFIILNPAPEVIYQIRHDSPLDVFRESYEFIVENWIEWFLPLALLLAPLGWAFFREFSRGVGKGVGLNIFDLLFMPGFVLARWLRELGMPDPAGTYLVILLTPPVAVLMLLFRGHLFAALRGTSRRQRLFGMKGQRED